MSDKNTVTVTFITNHEINVDEIDLRRGDLRKQLGRAIVPGTANPQEVLGVTDSALKKTREKIREAKNE